MNGERAVVVGADGGEPSTQAVRWAAAEAVRRHAPLRVVVAYYWRTPVFAVAPAGELAEAARWSADLLVEDIAREMSVAHPEADVRTEVVQGHPAEVLLTAGEDAALLVLGTRGRHATVGAVLGSVSQQVAVHARCPVVVVRGRTDPTGDVIVGVDGSEPSDRALALGFDEARQRGCGLLALRAVETPLVPVPVGAPPLVYDTAEIQRALTEQAVGQVARASERCPDVRWECHGVVGDAADVLVERSQRAQLAVVGSRGHGGFTGLLLGSVGLRLLHRAHCPVMIAHGAQGSDGPV
ncbi:universal stress protein [Dactylosporangium aurantiacum]|uniref:Universal stress protein n=1 Tax=Dactylosporangium aurantiacum TaxID=35754 RepID=A0A9Q9INY8_9ACTN|nr:universal stress protein [Dactylosporangium aurantiacum]MDG6108307.1 universal stress protein [Dactylosporangium aurantiacum]UWZ58503.1 universal stress protein [Dactylosporangium aurantiacum]